jgi:4a-hydroxytetrahydrobiopterin dehydratase
LATPESAPQGLGYQDRDPEGEDLMGPQRNRIHIDIWVPHDQAEAGVVAAIAAGGHLASDEHAPEWWTMADAEGNEADVATTMGRD